MQRSKRRKMRRHAKMRRAFTALASGTVLLLLCLVLIAILTGLGQSSKLLQNRNHAPDYALSRYSIWSGEALPDSDVFIQEYARPYVDATRYVLAPSNQVGDQDIAILLQLTDGTTRTENAVLTIRDRVVRWELGTEATPAQLLGKGFENATFATPLASIGEIGTYPMTIINEGEELEFELIAQDTTAPLVTLRAPEELNFYVNQQLTAMDFVTNCVDVSPVEFHFSQEPSTLLQGVETVQLIVTDAAGNSETFDLTYNVNGDGEPPVISGYKNIQTIAGVPVDYLRGVSARDAHDGKTEVIAKEPAGFSIRTPGDYPITYQSTDAAGNVAEERIILTVYPSIDDVEKLSEDDIMHIGDYIVKSLNLGDLKPREQLKKIYNQVQGHMMYRDNHHILDWQYAAVVAIYQGYGDCRNYFAYSRLLLTCAGFENMMVEKVKVRENQNNHYWNLVKVEGAWYHFDATPRNNADGFFLWTDDQMDAYSARNDNCFNRDKSLYPATPST